LSLSRDDLDDLIINLHDAINEAPREKRHSPEISDIEVSWLDAVRYDLRGETLGLKPEIIAKLLCTRYKRIGDSLITVDSGIAKIVDKQELKSAVLQELAKIKMDGLWSMNSYALIYDHLCAQVEETSLDTTPGRWWSTIWAD
jgi:hypothetical protein